MLGRHRRASVSVVSSPVTETSLLGRGSVYAQYSTVQYSTVQYSTVQYSTAQYSTVQYSTSQYKATYSSEEL